MEDVLMVGKKTNSCNVSKLVVHALHSNFAKLTNVERNAYIPHKNGGGGGGLAG